MGDTYTCKQCGAQCDMCDCLLYGQTAIEATVESLRATVARLERERDVHVPPMIIYERREDMSPDGRLSVLIENDGDAIVTVTESYDFSGRKHEYPVRAQVQFCTYSGGGKSQRVLAALRALAKAIDDENRENPDPRVRLRRIASEPESGGAQP